MKTRKCIIYKKSEAEMSELKRGDIFSMLKADKFDVNTDPHEVFVATSDAIPDPNHPGRFLVDVKQIYIPSVETQVPDDPFFQDVRG